MKHVWHIAAAALSLLLIVNCYAETDTATETAPASATTEEPQKEKNARLWNLQDADILSVINEVSLETGKNFVVDPRVTGKISLISSKPIQPDEVYQIFLSVLELLGYSAMPSGNVVKIVPNMESTEFASRMATANSPGKGEEVVVRVIPLENVSASQLIPVVRPMLPQWSNVTAYTPGNVLILLGRASNLQRIANVIRNIEQSASNNVDVVPLRQASAAQIATVVANLQNAARASGDAPQVSIAADERSNSILLSGNKSARLHMKFLISQLDRPSTGSQGNTEVIYLRYLQAAKFAPLLGKIAQNMMGKKDDSPASTTTTTSSSSSTTNKKETPENLTNIQAEPSTNSLIITAPPTMMRALNSVVAKLDIRPAQVLVEGIIVEVDDGDLKSLGIQWGTGSSNSSTSNTPTDTASTPFSFPPLGAGTLGIIPHTNITAILSVLESISGTNILATPSISVLDNQKATLEIGQDVPIQTGSYATTGGTNTVTPFNTITMKPVTLKLIVTPQINLGNAVRLLINLRNDSLQNPTSPGLTPLINTSSIQNSVIVNSEDILVLGGLISDNVTETTNKVPILGDVPIIGKAFFTQRSRQLIKKHLLVFIKPTIVRTTEDAMRITHTKYDMTRAAQLSWPQNLVKTTPEHAPNVLPLWKNDVKLPKPFETTNQS